MASIENQYVEIRISLTAADEETLRALKKGPKEIAVDTADAAVKYCEAQQSMMEGTDNACGLGSIVIERLTNTEVGFYCEKLKCFDQTICEKFAGRMALLAFNAPTEM